MCPSSEIVRMHNLKDLLLGRDAPSLDIGSTLCQEAMINPGFRRAISIVGAMDFDFPVEGSP